MVWRNENTEPFGDSVPDENPSGLGAFEFPQSISLYYRDKETGNLYAQKRDAYSSAIGGFTQPDPLGVAGQIRENAEVSHYRHFLSGRYDLATGRTSGDDLRSLSFMSERRVPETILYSYAGSNPLRFTDPSGEVVREAAVVITASVVGGTIYAMYDCARKCETACPIAQTGDPQSSRERDVWILNCKVGCVKSFGGFLRKYGSPTPPVEGIIER